MKVLFHLFLLVITLGSWAQPTTLPKISARAAQQDLELFKEILFEAHPNPYRFSSKEAFSNLFDSHAKLLEDSTDQIFFFQIFASLMAHVGEGHSSVKISDEIKSWMETKAFILPFEIHFFNKRAFIRKDESNAKGDLEGFEITTINDMPISEIMQQIDSLSSLGTAVNNALQYRKLSLLKNFSLAYYLFIEQQSTYHLKVKDLNGKSREIDVTGNPIDFDFIFTQELEDLYPPYSIDIDTANSLAIIKITSFAHWVHNLKFKDYEKFYQIAFEILDEISIKHLVIDVRNNRGGHEYLGAKLLSYLIREPFFLETSIFAKNFKFPLLDSLGVAYDGLGEKAYQEIDTGYLVKESIVLEQLKPNKKYPYRGNVYFLVNGNCFSACNIFMALADFHNIGTIIGEETGGIYQDTDGYFRINYTLPNSGLKISFPLWHIKTAVTRNQYGRGVFPDLPIQPSIGDVLGRKDAMMEKVYELIDQTK